MKTMPGIRAIVYIRMSTQEQAESGLAIKTQIQRCKVFCENRGWEIVSIIKDKGEGTYGIQQALRLLQQKEANTLLVLKFDRPYSIEKMCQPETGNLTAFHAKTC